MVMALVSMLFGSGANGAADTMARVAAKSMTKLPLFSRKRLVKLFMNTSRRARLSKSLQLLAKRREVTTNG